MKEESPPFHPIEKEKSMVMDKIAMANFPSPYRGVVKHESPSHHLTEKEKRMVINQVAMTNFPSPYRERGRE